MELLIKTSSLIKASGFEKFGLPNVRSGRRLSHSYIKSAFASQFKAFCKLKRTITVVEINACT